jgi:hypothetical protein
MTMLFWLAIAFDTQQKKFEHDLTDDEKHLNGLAERR